MGLDDKQDIIKAEHQGDLLSCVYIPFVQLKSKPLILQTLPRPAASTSVSTATTLPSNSGLLAPRHTCCSRKPPLDASWLPQVWSAPLFWNTLGILLYFFSWICHAIYLTLCLIASAGLWQPCLLTYPCKDFYDLFIIISSTCRLVSWDGGDFEKGQILSLLHPLL